MRWRRLHSAMWALILIGIALLPGSPFTSEASADRMVGVWRSVGYGEVLVVEERSFKIYTETSSSLIERHHGVRNGNTLTFETEKGTGVLVLETCCIYGEMNLPLAGNIGK